MAVVLNESIATVVHVSWNGDTRTVGWRFSKIDHEGNVQLLGSVERQGFETRFEYEEFAHQVFVEAIDVNGDTIGKSEVATTSRPARPSDDSLVLPEHLSVLQNGQGISQVGSSIATTEPAAEQTPEISLSVVAAGVAVGVIILACTHLVRKHGSRLLQQAQGARYKLLQQELDS
jgi:hypothetical protein